jgi:hypothetical protein
MGRDTSRRRFWVCLLLVGGGLGTIGGCQTGGSFRAKNVPTRVEVKNWRWAGLPGRHLATEHYDIYSTVTDTTLEQVLPKFLESAHAHYVKTVPPPPGEHPRMQVYVFGTRRQWERHTEHRYPRRSSVYKKIRRGGYTHDGDAVLFYTSRTGTLATLAHEGWHQYASTRFATRLPAWLDEGLACYHESFSFIEDEPQFTPKHNTLRINNLCDAVQSGELLPLRELTDTNAGRVISSYNSRIAYNYYAQAWALVTYLRHDSSMGNARAFNRLLEDLRAGQLKGNAGAARLTAERPSEISYGTAVFLAYFGEMPEDVEDGYLDYLVKLARF